MASDNELDPAATEYERLVSAMADLRMRARTILREAETTIARSAVLRAQSAALRVEHDESAWRAGSGS